jgi:hypothetical protein
MCGNTKHAVCRITLSNFPHFLWDGCEPLKNKAKQYNFNDIDYDTCVLSIASHYLNGKDSIKELGKIFLTWEKDKLAHIDIDNASQLSILINN